MTMRKRCLHLVATGYTMSLLKFTIDSALFS